MICLPVMDTNTALGAAICLCGGLRGLSRKLSVEVRGGSGRWSASVAPPSELQTPVLLGSLAPPSKPRALTPLQAVSFPDRRGGAVFNGPVTGEEPSCGRRVFMLPTDRRVKRRDAEFHQSEALPWRIPPASETGGGGVILLWRPRHFTAPRPRRRSLS